MTQQLTRKVTLLCAILFSLHIFLLYLVTFTTIFQGTLFEAFGITALIVPYTLQQIGLPVLENNGLSGRGWASPNILGWLLSAIAWFTFYWLVALSIVRLTLRLRPTR
jgi:hypothetical protein